MTAVNERRGTYRRTEDIYRKAIEDIRDYAIFMIDADGTVMTWNVGAQHILGYTEEEIIGGPAIGLKFVSNALTHAFDLKCETPASAIAAEHLPYIFERFRQVDSSNVRAHGGLGLGLAIVDYLVRQQSGIVSAESEGVDKGATFRVEFPLMSSELLAANVSPAELFSNSAEKALDSLPDSGDARLNGLRILLVEDDPDTQELLAAVLREHGAETLAVDSTARALLEVDRGKPDLIISDIGMAHENGYEFIQKVRRLEPEAGGRIPAIALTAYAGNADRRRALLAGFQTHLPKPVEPDDLLAAILSLTFQPPASQG